MYYLCVFFLIENHLAIWKSKDSQFQIYINGSDSTPYNVRNGWRDLLVAASCMAVISQSIKRAVRLAGRCINSDEISEQFKNIGQFNPSL